MANKVTAFVVKGSTYGVDADLTFDTTPTPGSSNPVTSNGIAVAVQGATIGDNISYGRTPNTPVGYCSVAYGQNVTATSPYGVTFGSSIVNNIPYSLVAGVSNNAVAGNVAFIAGNANSALGTFNTAIGSSNTVGAGIRQIITEGTWPQVPTVGNNDKIYVGYVDAQLKRVSYTYDESSHAPDPNSPIPITPAGTANVECYVVDMTNDVSYRPDQHPGDVYKYSRKNRVLTITKMDNKFVRLTDICHGVTFVYKGPCYYVPGTDKNYSDAAKTTEIPLTGSDYANVAYPGDVYFDVISGDFVLRPLCTNFLTDHRDWIKVKVYKGYLNIGSSEDIRWGQYAYIYPEYGPDINKRLHVFSTATFDDGTEITDRLFDGSIIIDMSGDNSSGYTMAARYWLDVNGVAYGIQKLSSTISNRPWSQHIPYGAAAMVLGNQNYTSGGTGCIVAGASNIVTKMSYGTTVLGAFNTVHVGQDFNGNLRMLVCGKSNTVKSNSIYFHDGMVVGQNNTFDGDGFSDLPFMLGRNNKIHEGALDSFIIGGYNECYGIPDQARVIGKYNIVKHQGYSVVAGDWNEVGTFVNWSYKDLKRTDDGKWKMDNTVIDPDNPSYPTNTIFSIYDIPDRSVDTYTQDLSEIRFIKYAYSSDGQTLSDITITNTSTQLILGDTNLYYRKTSQANPFTLSNRGNYLIGYGNKIIANGCIGIGLIGRGLGVEYNLPGSATGTPREGAIFLGSFNTMDGLLSGDDAQMIVGIGTSTNDRKNGFVVWASGNVTAPSAYNTMAAAISHAHYDTDKLVITYGMLKDYAPKNGGGVGRPSVDVVTLAAADWSSFSQTVTLTGIKSDSIVMISPQGNPHSFYYDEIYLDSQADDELTFGCSAAPSVDIQVKVVYWV